MQVDADVPQTKTSTSCELDGRCASRAANVVPKRPSEAKLAALANAVISNANLNIIRRIKVLTM